MNLNSLRVFACVAQHCNLQRAADELNLTRGAVSQRIKQLEIDLGVTLLERQARGVVLTPEGARCQEAVDKALATLETMVAELGREGEQITLHLGSSTAAKWLMPRMGDFAARFPRISLRTEVHSQQLSRDLARNEIAIWPGKTSDPRPFQNARALTDICLVAVCSPNFPRPDWPMDLETLLMLPLLQDEHRRWEALIASTGFRPRHRLLNFDRSALALDAAIEGHGVAIAPTYIVENDVNRKRLVEVWVSPEPPTQQLFVSWSHEHVRQPYIDRVVDWIASEFSSEQVRKGR
ncbi:LysR family transcriptional regulator [Chachezhania sediminis]|uniref:LysR family transcriptional regulator n=1 Tax=Chachezhania sediminis TaxID=2599291 RepID=UPI00131CD6B8|nr:LysR family transcriptional regulator [Chachezhania sediminis]